MGWLFFTRGAVWAGCSAWEELYGLVVCVVCVHVCVHVRMDARACVVCVHASGVCVCVHTCMCKDEPCCLHLFFIRGICNM